MVQIHLKFIRSSSDEVCKKQAGKKFVRSSHDILQEILKKIVRNLQKSIVNSNSDSVVDVSKQWPQRNLIKLFSFVIYPLPQ